MRLLIILLFLCTSMGGYSQALTSVEKQLAFNRNKLRIADIKKASFEEFLESNYSDFGLTADDALVAYRQFQKRNGQTVERYKQFYKGIEVVGSDYIVHFHEGQVYKLVGTLLPGINLETQQTGDSSYDREGTRVQLLNSMKERDYPDFSQQEWDWTDRGLRIIDKSFPEFSGDYCLARMLSIQSEGKEIPMVEDVYIDATTGQLICHFSNVHFHRVKGVANTRYYGEKEIYIDSLAPELYMLKDAEKRIYTLDGSRDTFTNHDKYWNQYNQDQNEVAGDVHFGASSFHQMMESRYDWIGLDGDGRELSSVVHARGRYYVNAYWDGIRANFGNGDCDRYSPLTTLAIVGHEFVHGLTDHTSDLIYRNESGALNESISDIFGKALEYYYDNINFNWLLGDKIRKSPEAKIFRSMEDPNVRSHPKYYAGQFWKTGSSDNGGVHSNSGVLNYWFYLLAEGGSGVNEAGYSYKVTKIGMGKALDLVFEIQRAYLTANSAYIDAMYYSISASEDLYGKNSKETEAVVEAWKAVGMEAGMDRYDLSIETVDISGVLCPGESYFPQYIIRHVGKEMIPAGSELSLNLREGLQINITEPVMLYENFLPGDSIMIEFEQDLGPMLRDQKVLHAKLLFEPDGLLLNNTVSQAVRTSVTAETDIELLLGEFGYYEECGEQDIAFFRYRIGNTGCNLLSKDDTLLFKVKTDKGDFTLERSLFIDLSPGTILGSTIGMLFLPVPHDFTEYEVELVVSGDERTENNSVAGHIEFRDFVPQNYFEGFESDENLDLLNISGNNDFVMDSLVYWRSSRVLALGATREHSNYSNCTIDTDFLDQYYLKSRLSFCVDTRGMDEPSLSFDLMQKRYDNPFADLVNPLYSSMVQMVLDNPDFDAPVIYGQEASQFIHHEFILPTEYVGPVSFEIANLNAFNLNPSSDFFADRDLVAIDNIRLHGKASYLTDIDAAEYIVFPNPASHILRVLNRDQTQRFSIELYNSLGQRIFEKAGILNQYWVDISVYPAGVYQLVIFENGKRVSSRPVVLSP